MTHWYDDSQWDRVFKDADNRCLEYNGTRPLTPLKYFNDCPDLRRFRVTWIVWDIPAGTRYEWDAMIHKAFHTPLEVREELQP